MKRFKFVLGVVLAAMATATTAWAAQPSWAGKGHLLMIKLPFSHQNSIMVQGTALEGYSAQNSDLNQCRNNSSGAEKWKSTGYVLKNGSRVAVLAYSNPECSGQGATRIVEVKDVPKNDGLTNVWVDLTD